METLPVTRAVSGSQWRSGRVSLGVGPRGGGGWNTRPGLGQAQRLTQARSPTSRKENTYEGKLPESLLGESVPIPLITVEEERKARGFRVQDQRLDRHETGPRASL